MAYTLGHVQYGKAEVRVVRVFRDVEPHEFADYNVSVSLTGNVTGAWLSGDNSTCLTTDAMKNTVNAFARAYPAEAKHPESFGLLLARHFVEDIEPVARARVRVEAFGWGRLCGPDGAPHPHVFARDGRLVRTATITATQQDGDVTTTAVSGISELTVLKTTDSEYSGFLQDPYTTLRPTDDRILATSVTAQWLHTDADAAHDWAGEHAAAVDALTAAFAAHHSLALQHTLFEMGGALLDSAPGVEEVRLSMPNKHHFLIDLSAFGLDNPGEVFHADDRPYGLIEGTVLRQAESRAGDAFDPGQGW